MLLEMFTHSGVLAKMGILIAFAPVVAATLYAIKPSERRLSFFARSHWPHCSQGSRRSRRGSSPYLKDVRDRVDKSLVNLVVLGIMETFVALFFAFGCLTITWLLVALGMRRVG